jgi:hypothetical protein
MSEHACWVGRQSGLSCRPRSPRPLRDRDDALQSHPQRSSIAGGFRSKSCVARHRPAAFQFQVFQVGRQLWDSYRPLTTCAGDNVVTIPPSHSRPRPPFALPHVASDSAQGDGATDGESPARVTIPSNPPAGPLAPGFCAAQHREWLCR